MSTVYELLSLKYNDGKRDASNWIQLCVNHAISIPHGEYRFKKTIHI